MNGEKTIMTEKVQFTEINKIPALTWNWLKMNRDSFELSGAPAKKFPQISSIPNGVTVIQEGEISLSKFPAIKNGVGDEICAYLEKNIFNGIDQIITANGTIAEPLVLSFPYMGAGESAESESFASSQIIYARENAELTVIFVYEGDSSKIDSIIRTKIYAEENAKVHVIKVQLLGENQNQIDDTASVLLENAVFRFTQIELGGNHVDSGMSAELSGYKSKIRSNLAFICTASQHLDINHSVIHTGSETDTKMLVKGSLDGNAVKTYRGTIDFKNGCRDATGDEQEETLLLSKTAVNKSIPVILCDEENVSGTHGATLGRLGAEELFYMQSRGISESEAKKMITKAKVLSTASLIPNEEIRSKIETFLG